MPTPTPLASVAEAAAYGYAVESKDLTRASARIRGYVISRPLTFEDGAVPEWLVELTASVAARLAATPTALAVGATSEMAGNEQVMFGSDAFRGSTSLTSEEKSVLDRHSPRRIRTILLEA